MPVETPNLVPVTPQWMERHSSASTARSINPIYWARADTEENAGWILVGPSAVIGNDGRPLTRQAEQWIRKGRKPLVEYSYTDEVSPKTGKRETIELNKDRLNTEYRYWWLFKNGGAHLFPIDQIVAHHWHITPPYGLSKDVFPQLREWDVPDPLWCAACPGGRPPFNAKTEFVTHAMVHHKMTEPQALDLFKYASNPPVGKTGLNIRRKAQVTEAKAEAAGITPIDMPSPEPAVQGTKNICNFCGENFPKGLAMHQKWCKARPAAQTGDQSDQVPVDPDKEESWQTPSTAEPESPAPSPS